MKHFQPGRGSWRSRRVDLPSLPAGQLSRGSLTVGILTVLGLLTLAPFAPFGPLAPFAPLARVRADTVYLKDGTHIPDCKVTRETPTQVWLRTPVGDMAVPRTEIDGIQRSKTVFDTYEERRAAIRDDDAAGLYKLARWARSTPGLRKESDALLEEVASLRPDHAETRRLLGHAKLGDEWVVPEPLSLSLEVRGQDAEAIRKNLGLLLKTRRDVRLEGEPSSVARTRSRPAYDSEDDSGYYPEIDETDESDDTDESEEADEGEEREDTGGSEEIEEPDELDAWVPPDLLDACTLKVSAVISRKAGTRFHGLTVGQGALGATVRLEAQSPWIGKTQVRTAVDGEVPASSGDASLAIRNALSAGGESVQRFLDQITALRVAKIEEAYREAERKKAELKAKRGPEREAGREAGREEKKAGKEAEGKAKPEPTPKPTGSKGPATDPTAKRDA